MAEHTPGPWRANVFKDGRGGVWQDPSSAAVFVTNNITPEDARLMAAAPELLGALEGLMPTKDGGGDNTSLVLIGVTMGHLRAARAAIAKARGEEA